jgi:hypothetical protein
MSGDTEVYRTLGQQEATIKAMNDKLEEFDDRLKSVERNVQLILDKINQVGGGWKAIAGMGMAIYGALAGLKTILEFLHVLK